MNRSVSFSAQIKELSQEHRKRAISQEEYRRERKIVLDNIDRYFNGAEIAEPSNNADPREDVTVPYRLEDGK